MSIIYFCGTGYDIFLSLKIFLSLRNSIDVFFCFCSHSCFLKASIQIGLLNLFNFRLNITNVLLYDMGKNFTSFALVLNLCMFTNVCIYTMIICVFYKIK